MKSKKVRNSEKGLMYMELAKITSKGQITIPIEIRKKLGLKDGDKVLFLEEGNKVVMVNSTLLALKEAQKAFEGEAEKAGIKDEQDIVDLIKQIRKEG
jgi:AbrB family looped-hinge helix DNA binding protein